MDKPGILASLLRWISKEEGESHHEALPPSAKWSEEERKEHGGATGKKWAKEEAAERPKPGMLGTGGANAAAKSYRGRRGQIEKAIDEATGD